VNLPLHEEALETLEDEAVRAQGGKDRANVLEMFRVGAAEDQNTVEEDKHEATQEKAKHLIHHSSGLGRRTTRWSG
jgi:hypothetical protein